MTDELLLKRGYKQFAPSAIDPEIVVAMFQKRFDDKYGKKYFINVKKNSQSFIPESHRGENWTEFSYTYEVQVSMTEEDKTINLEFFSNWTVDEVEAFVEKMFNVMEMNYYELWDCESRHTRPKK